MKWNSSVAKRLAGLSLEDASAETIALSFALGLVFGIFPMYGCPTLLCAAAAIVLRLNFPALQLVNYLTTPLQLVLLAPFHRVGARLFPARVDPAAALPGIFHVDSWRLVTSFWTAAMHAIVGWFCVCAPLGLLLYFMLRYIVRRRRKNVSIERNLQRLLNAAA